QPPRVEILNRAALAACADGDGRLGVAVSIGTAEEAGRAQGQTVAHFAREASATVTPLGADFWTTYEGAMAPAEAVHLQVGTLVTHVGATATEIERAVADARGVGTVTGSATPRRLR